MKKIIKNFLFGKGNLQKIRAGIGKGLIMNTNVSNKSQRLIGLDEYEIQNIFKVYSQKASYFFDIGASDGYYSLIFRKHNKTAEIFQFEVKEWFKNKISENFSLNNFLPDYHFYSKFASDKIDDQNISIDSIFNKEGEQVLVKIDVDGGEVDVLKGMAKTVKNNKCLFVIETHSIELEKNCINFLTDNGYLCKIINPGWFRKILPEKRVIEHNRWLIAEKKS